MDLSPRPHCSQSSPSTLSRLGPGTQLFPRNLPGIQLAPQDKDSRQSAPPSLFHCSSPGVTPRGVWPGRWAYSTVPTPCSSQCGSFLPWLRDPQSTWWFLQSRKQSQVFLLQQRKPRQGPYRPPAPRPRLRLLLLTLQLVCGGGTCSFSLLSCPDSRLRPRSFSATPACVSPGLAGPLPLRQTWTSLKTWICLAAETNRLVARGCSFRGDGKRRSGLLPRTSLIQTASQTKA